MVLSTERRSPLSDELEYITQRKEIPVEFRLDAKPFTYTTDDGRYQLVQAIDGDWARCIEGRTPWGHDDWVKLSNDFQVDRHDGAHQVFIAWDDMAYDVGVLKNIAQ